MAGSGHTANKSTGTESTEWWRDAVGGMEVLDKGWVRLMTPSLGAVWDEAHVRSRSPSLSLSLARASVSSLSLSASSLPPHPSTLVSVPLLRRGYKGSA